MDVQSDTWNAEQHLEELQAKAREIADLPERIAKVLPEGREEDRKLIMRLPGLDAVAHVFGQINIAKLRMGN